MWCCPFFCFSNLKWLNKDGEFKGGGGRGSQTAFSFKSTFHFLERAVSTLRSNLVIFRFKGVLFVCLFNYRDFWKIELVNF